MENASTPIERTMSKNENSDERQVRGLTALLSFTFFLLAVMTWLLLLADVSTEPSELPGEPLRDSVTIDTPTMGHLASSPGSATATGELTLSCFGAMNAQARTTPDESMDHDDA
ncbi:hypothetical protein BWO91_14780 [Plantibacter flavus]|nr:hypothetical protein BWO91_14780 [Plantibacter flavus]